MTSRLASVTFKMASKVFIEETDKNFDVITEIPFRFLGFGDFKIPIVTENKTLVLFGNETSSGVRNSISPVGCRLVQVVVYRVLFVTMSTELFQRRDMF